MITKLLQAIQDKIAAISGIAYADENWGQLDDYASNAPVKFPCALIDLNTAQWTNKGQHLQSGTATIAIDIARQKLTNTSAKASAWQKEKAWEIHDLMSNVHQAIHGQRLVKGCGAIVRTSTAKVRRQDGIQHYRILYTCTVQCDYETGINIASGAEVSPEIILEPQ
jgi:hypothetical protein